jgi:hypothetical protein
VKKMITLLAGLLLALLLAGPAGAADGTYKSWPAQQGVSPNKVWQVRFSVPMRADSINSANIYVLDAGGASVPVNVSLDPADPLHRTVLVEPLEPYTAGATYTLYILKSVTSETGAGLRQEVRMSFTIAAGAGSPSDRLFGMVRQVNEETGTVYVDVAGRGQNLSYEYNESWYPYGKASPVMLDGSGSVVPVAPENLIVDQIWDFSGSKLRFVNHPGAYPVADQALIELVDQNGDLIRPGWAADLSAAADSGRNARALVDPSTGQIMVVVIEH